MSALHATAPGFTCFSGDLVLVSIIFSPYPTIPISGVTNQHSLQ